MVYHADPQLFVKLCDRSIQFLQGANEVVDLCDPAHILLGGNCLFLIFLFHPAVAFPQLIKFLATRFIHHLEGLNCKMLKADAKAQVSYDYESGRITTFLCSVQHSEDASPEDIRGIIEPLMILTAAEYGLNTDFEKLINPTGRFVIGGSKADCGVTGRKLACDTYGGIGRIGGGALSGKDPSKVDRSAAYMARKIARDIVQGGYADKCEVQIGYAIGKAEPVSVMVETFGTGRVCNHLLQGYIRSNYDLTPKGIIEYLHLLKVDYNAVSSGGHFGKDWLPWEMDEEEAEYLYGEE